MNKTYSIVWSEARQKYIVASELASKAICVKKGAAAIIVALSLMTGEVWAAADSCSNEEDGSTVVNVNNNMGDGNVVCRYTSPALDGKYTMSLNGFEQANDSQDFGYAMILDGFKGDAAINVIEGTFLNINLSDPASNTAMIAWSATEGDASITVAENANISITNTVESASKERDGIEATARKGNATINFSGYGKIETTNGNGLYAQVTEGGTAQIRFDSIGQVNNNPPITTITTKGDSGTSPDTQFSAAVDGIHAHNKGSATTDNAEIDIANGVLNIKATGNANGIFAGTMGGNAIVKVAPEATLTIDIEGSGTSPEQSIAGINAIAHENGNASIEFNSNDSSIKMSGEKDVAGLYASATNASKNSTGDATVNFLAGNIQLSNTSSALQENNYRDGIRAEANQGDATVTSAGTISTDGKQYSRGIIARSGTGNAIVNASGKVTTGTAADGLDNFGIYADVGIYDALTLSNADTTGKTASIMFGKHDADLIETNGQTSHGIYTKANLGADTKIDVKQGTVTTHGESAYALYGENLGSGDVTIDNAGTLITTGMGANAIQASAASGDITVNNRSGTIDVAGSKASGISVTNGTGTATVTNNAALEIGRETSDLNHGITVMRSGAGEAFITNRGDIKTRGKTQSSAIFTQTETGKTTINASGDIQTLGKETGNNGIEAQSQGGDVEITLSNSKVSVAGSANGIVVNNASSKQAKNVDVTIDAKSTVSGGTDDTSATTAGVFLRADNITLTNAGTIDAINDRAIYLDVSSPSKINNTGSITGFVQTKTNTSLTFTNARNLNLRHFTDSDNDGARDAKAVSVSTFGGADSTFVNTGTVALVAVDNDTKQDLTDQYTLDSSVHSIANDGVVQAQMLELGSFDNAGMIDLTAGGKAGDILVISGSNVAGTSGDGVYISNGGTLTLDTVLNEGGANSQSDMLVVDTVALGSKATLIKVNNAGGSGAVTVDNGIELVHVLGGKGKSAEDAFVLDGRVGIGAYEYDLHQGSVSDEQDGNWYLRGVKAPVNPDDNKPIPNPDDNNPPPAPDDGSSGVPDTSGNSSDIPDPNDNSSGIPDSNGGGNADKSEWSYSPETGAYLSNRYAATNMFLHTLHDRLGEVQYTDANRTAGDAHTGSAWGRIVSRHAKSNEANGTMDREVDTTVIQLGGDIASWSDTDNQGRYHLGIMGGWGKSDTDIASNDVKYTSNGTRRKAEGSVEGYSVGIYGTWFQNEAEKNAYPSGPYVDTWLMYGWYDNNVQGNGMANESYDSHNLTASVEAGWAFIVNENNNRQWLLEPQAQFAWNWYSQDDVHESDGTRVTQGDADGFISRLGLRAYTRDTQTVNGIQPFVEVNWWHDDLDTQMSFDSDSVHSDLPGDRVEVKVGLQGEFAKGWQAWGHAGVQYGENDLESYEGMVGIKYQF
ncbi:autotransporter outer membrane beta-barrel domain-containing protein [Enterobacter sp.]|uniref:autotransporter outer membrane beta-barrel domain-containing protein n=1 Tax=Enterobacter sp. TaxID=42895 RepID=UPI00296F6A59|nr:autotransporter outer membrane beta-barrel domain-containing protein [Enterobacter sp.]